MTPLDLLLGLALALILPTSSVTTKGPGATVFHRERARGVHPDLQQLLDDWAQSGTHDIVIAGGNGWPNGGLRTKAEVDAAHAGGLSNATDLSQTPHGRGAALDVWPVGFVPSKSFDAQPGMQDLMKAFGDFAVAKSLVWGGRFSGTYSPTSTVSGDWPHVELANWTSLPFPPPDYTKQGVAA